MLRLGLFVLGNGPSQAKNTLGEGLKPQSSLLLIIDKCTITYDDIVLDFSKPKASWARALGKARKTTTTSETWVVDNLGFKLLVNPATNIVRSVSIVLFKGEVNDSSLVQIKREANQAHPND